MRLPTELLPMNRDLTEEDVFRIDAWTATHEMSWADREDARLRVRRAVNASTAIQSFSLRALNRPKVFRGTVQMMDWLIDGPVSGPYDSSVKISEAVAAVNFRWHMVRTWLRKLRGQRILVLACGVAREVDRDILQHNDVTLIDGYPDEETSRRLGAPIQKLNVFRDKLPEYDVLVCLGLLDYVPANKKMAVMKRWESFGAAGSRMLVGQVRATVDMKRIHVSMNWPLHTWPSEQSYPYAVYNMNASYYMILKGMDPEELQDGLNGGTLRYNFTPVSRL